MKINTIAKNFIFLSLSIFLGKTITMFFVAICLIAFSPATSFAQAGSEGAKVVTEAVAEEEQESLEERLIKGNIVISQWLDQMAENLDNFLVSKKLKTEKNKSSLKLESALYLNDNSDYEVSNSIQANLRLPKVEKYFQLKFANYDETAERRSQQQSAARKTSRQQNYGASLGFFRQIGNVKTVFQPRIALQDPLNASHSLRFESNATSGSYEVNPKVEFYADATKGTGIYFGLNFRKELNAIYAFRITNEAEYEDIESLLSVANGFSIDQSVSRTKSYSYSLFFNSINKTAYNLDSYVFSISRYHLIYKNILDYSITPHLDFLRAKSFKGNPGISITVSLNF